MSLEELKKYDAEVEFQMEIRADADWSIPHDPIGGRGRPFHIGGSLSESAVIALYNGTDITLTHEYVRYLFEKLESESKGTVDKKCNEWLFKFNKHKEIYSSLDDYKPPKRRRSRRR
ncbi:hypothetical protein [Fibrobacter sp.]|uniref:hypothetical protein n=1 Tax=Fibrobacter sp. TaxID=35828 RepID=UPI003863999A